MRVCILHDYPIHYKHLLFRSLVAVGLEIHVIYFASRSKLRFEVLVPQPDDYSFSVGWRGNFEEAPVWRKMHHAWVQLSKAKPQLMVIHGYYSLECWIALLWAIVSRTPRVLWFESNEFDKRRSMLKEFLKRLFVRRLDSAQVYGESSASYMRRLGLKQERICIKGPIVDADRFRTGPEGKRYTSGTDKKLLYIGRLTEVKNISFLLECFSNVTQGCSKPMTLTLAGDGPQRSFLEAKCKALGIAPLVHFAGYVEQANLPSLARGHDLLILPSLYEPYGLVAIEGMLCRLPIVLSTQCGAAVDLIRPNTGWKFSPSQPEELQAILRIVCALSKNELERMGRAAFDIGNSFSPEYAAERIATDFRRLGFEWGQSSGPSINGRK